MIHLIDRHSANLLPIGRAVRLLFAKSHILLSLAACALFVSVTAQGAENDANRELREVFKSVKNAVVRIKVTEAGHSGVGTIVTSDGHIVLHGAGHLKGQSLIVHLPDGRRAEGVLSGWSTEWNVALAKITDPGPWPFVEMAPAREGARVNDPCFAVGYVLEEAGWKALPEQRQGRIKKSIGPLWFTSSIRGNPVGEPHFAFGPVFDEQGKMLGNTAGEPYGGDSIQLHAHQIRALWQQLLHGDVDQRRLFGDAPENGEKRPYLIAAVGQGNASSSLQAKERAVSCTVGLRRKTGNRWSGVIISADGWVATCAHGGGMPGDRVVVELPDGRRASARVTGVNPITDIALIEIRDEGPWPFAELSDNSDVKPDTPCWFVGYPADRVGRDPLVRKTKVVHPKESEGRLLYTDADYSQSGGDSGGGVFDLSGRLLAINEGKEQDAPGRHPRIETLRLQWDSLADLTFAK